MPGEIPSLDIQGCKNCISDLKDLSTKLTAKKEEVFHSTCGSMVDQGLLENELKECNTCE